MLKILAIFASVLLFFHVGACPQSHTTKGASRRDKPIVVASPAVPNQENSSKVQSETNDHIQADVRVTSAPGKDRYDKAAFWISVVLAAAGIAGIGVGV